MPFFRKLMGLENDKGERSRSAQVVKAFESYKNCLQILSYQVGHGTDGDRFVMKCPLHIFFIKEILEVFPDAKLIWFVEM
jgi:hypothetical protein